MRVTELQTAIANYDEASLKEIIESLYKIIPKKTREEHDLDELLLHFRSGKTKLLKKDPPVDFYSLRDEIELFLLYANAHYFIAPNRIVHKNRRSKWRFEVRNFIKGLIGVSGEHAESSAHLLAEIYAMLCYGCNFYIFPSETPFTAVGYSQPDLLRLALEKIFYNGYGQPEIRRAVFLTLDSTTDRHTIHSTLLNVLTDKLKTTAAKEVALAQCLAYQKEYQSYQNFKNFFKYPTGDTYRATEHFNFATELYLILQLSLQDPDSGIDFFWKNYKEKQKEIVLYCLLRELSDDNDLWLREYKKALAMGITPRDSLKMEFAKRKQGLF